MYTLPPQDAEMEILDKTPFWIRPKGQQSENLVSSALDDSPGGRLRELDGWRALSVLLVVLYHIGSYQHPSLLPHVLGLDRMVHNSGDLGVKIFFVISGFVICRLLILEEFRYGSVSLKSFYYRRVFRILPALYSYLFAVAALLSLGLIHEQWKAILGSSLFLYDVNIPPWSWLVGHTWSLAVEEQFYLAFPALWILTPKRWKSRIFLGVCFLCTGWNLIAIHTGWDEFLWSHAREGFACISCGVLMAIHEGRARTLAASVPAFVVGLAALALLAHPVGSHGWQAALYKGLVMPPAICLLLLFSLESRRGLRVFLCSKPMQAVGLTSYGIYLWQQLFTAPKEFFAGTGVVIPFLLPLLCLIVPMSYLLIEQPAMRYGKFLSRRARLSAEARALIIGRMA